MRYETLLVEAKGCVVKVTLNRPEVLNALNSVMFHELSKVFQRLAKDDQARAILLTGSGRAFAAGSDIEEIRGVGAVMGEALSRHGQRVFRLIEMRGKPVIALVNGFALGGGCELAMACTIRVASATAMMGLPEVRLGLIPAHGGTQRLPRMVGRSRALKMMLTGEMVGAEEALRLGLVDEVVAEDELMSRGEELAEAIAGAAPLAVAGVLEAVQAGYTLAMEDGLNLEAGVFGRVCGSMDAVEGTGAFLEKRPALWRGR